jgi:acyl-CoA dehydrogenase
MNDQRNMLEQTVDGLFGEIAAEAANPGSAGLDEGQWQKVRELGICELFLAEDQGGFGGNWQDAAVVLHASGRHALALPVAETLVARRLLAQAGISQGSDMAITLAGDARLQIDTAQGSVSGTLHGVAWAQVGLVLCALEEGGREYLALLDPGHCSSVAASPGAAGEPRADLCFSAAQPLALVACEAAADTLLASAALMRAAQMGGALEAALTLTMGHVNERVQFGRALSRFQVIQHQLALLAEEAAAVGCAVNAACLAFDCGGDTELAIAAAKLRANRAVTMATSIAHQLHGAIGFTHEHRLHRFTQRLWRWRSDFGNDRYWARRLGRMIVAGGATQLWSRMTGT